MKVGGLDRMNGDERFKNKRIENANEMYGPIKDGESNRMRQFTLKRIAYIPDGTFGVLFDGDIPFCLTLEREWKNNKKGESCIPTGRYICKRFQSPKFGNTFEITDVFGRTYILFHKGNIEDDSHGCVITGEEYGEYKGKIAVLSSGKAFNEFILRTTGINTFYLIITECDIAKGYYKYAKGEQ